MTVQSKAVKLVANLVVESRMDRPRNPRYWGGPNAAADGGVYIPSDPMEKAVRSIGGQTRSSRPDEFVDGPHNVILRKARGCEGWDIRWTTNGKEVDEKSSYSLTQEKATAKYEAMRKQASYANKAAGQHTVESSDLLGSLQSQARQIVNKVEQSLGDVISDETPDPGEEAWTLCVDAAHELGLEDPRQAAELACSLLGYPRGQQRNPEDVTVDLRRLAPGDAVDSDEPVAAWPPVACPDELARRQQQKQQWSS